MEDKARLFRERLLESMRKEMITQKELVEKTGITKGAISSYMHHTLSFLFSNSFLCNFNYISRNEL